MLSIQIDDTQKRVYVEVSGYINKKESSDFLNQYKQMTRGIRSSQYNLVVKTSMFDCEEVDDIRNVCMAFMKSGYKKMYLVDPNSYIMSTMSLGPIEKKLFTKSVKIVKSVNDIK
ncbi:MAG: hypothetical protein ACRDA3_03325 [Peptostreptococcaceae bacterium]